MSFVMIALCCVSCICGLPSGLSTWEPSIYCATLSVQKLVYNLLLYSAQLSFPWIPNNVPFLAKLVRWKLLIKKWLRPWFYTCMHFTSFFATVLLHFSHLDTKCRNHRFWRHDNATEDISCRPSCSTKWKNPSKQNCLIVRVVIFLIYNNHSIVLYPKSWLMTGS